MIVYCVLFVSRRALLSNELENVEQQLEAKVSLFLNYYHGQCILIDWIELLMLQKAELEQETNNLQAEKTGGSNEHLRCEVDYLAIFLSCLSQTSMS